MLAHSTDATRAADQKVVPQAFKYLGTERPFDFSFLVLQIVFLFRPDGLFSLKSSFQIPSDSLSHLNMLSTSTLASNTKQF